MNTFPFEYELPPRLIAQHPAIERDLSRLMVVHRNGGSISHHVFRDLPDLPDLLEPADLLILNDTQVLPARLLGHRARTGGKWEGLFIRQDAEGRWDLLCRGSGKLRAGETIEIEPGPLRLRLDSRTADGHWRAHPEAEGSTLALLQRHGQVPLPPYIRKGKEEKGDRERYQTVYAGQPGAVAAPTAGLHFTTQVFDRLRQRGIARSFLTLHVGPGTFQPIQVEDVAQHRMHGEWGELPAATVEAIRSCRQRGGRIVAVGTTSVRVLETVAAQGELQPWSGETSLFIFPPYRFCAVDMLVTNFHLPRSTLLLLVAAFAGAELLHRAYEEAVREQYRFYSYGDAMLII